MINRLTGHGVVNCAEKHLHRYVAEFEFRYNNRWRSALRMESAAKMYSAASLAAD